MLLKLGVGAEAARNAPAVVKELDGEKAHVFAHTTSREGKAVLALAIVDAAAPAASALSLSTLQIDADGGFTEAEADAIAERLEGIYRHTGVPTRLRDLEIPREDLINIARGTVKNYNFNAGNRSAEDQIAASNTLLEAAW